MGFLLGRAFCVLSVACFSLSAAEWTVDPAHSSASFAVKHMMVSTVHGSFSSLKGIVDYTPPRLSDAKVNLTIDVSTLDTRNDRRDTHLKSPDFFDVQKYPTITFQSKKIVTGEKSGQFKLVGDMTMHGVTKEVTFDVQGPETPVKDPKGGLHSGASASTRINRRDFGLVWNKALEAGGVTVGDEVDLTVEVELVQSKTS